MSIPKKLKTLEYIDRDSKPKEVVESFISKVREQLEMFVEMNIEQLQDKAGEFRTLQATFEVLNREMDRMMFFFRGAVVPYYVRQQNDLWDEKIPTSLVEKGVEEIKMRTGFILYDHLGKPTDETNSITTFRNTKQFSEWLTQVENVCFIDEGLFFPDSEHFNKLVEKKGRTEAQRQVLHELKVKYDSMFNQNI